MKTQLLFIITLVVFLSSCISSKKESEVNQASQSSLPSVNGIYYWKTVFNLDSAEKSFCHQHDIKRIYLRMFDVVEDEYGLPKERAIPNATVKINDNKFNLTGPPQSLTEIIPVVYITIEALRAMAGNESILASNIVTRVRNMCQYNEIKRVKELQLDCDWTTSTESSFFSLCESVKQCLQDMELPWRLSSTIRLHQLSHKIPPVDRGVLMVYNTGNFNNPDVKNSIISVNDVKPYMKYLKSYGLPIDIAYPTYSWQLLFRNRQFVGLMSGVNLSDTVQFKRRDTNLYEARKDIPYKNRIIRAGDIIREETSDYNDVARVKDMIEKHLTGNPHSNILYHLDYKNLSKYSPDEIDYFFATDN